MSRQKFFTIATVVLLLLNTATLIFFFTSKQGPPPPPNDTANFIIQQLHLDENQQKQFEHLKEEHQQSVQRIRDEDQRLHHVYFDMLKKNVAEQPAVDSITSLIGQQRKAMEMAMFDHFKKIRALCNKEQEQKFNTIIDEITKRLSPPPQGQGPLPGKP